MRLSNRKSILSFVILVASITSPSITSASISTQQKRDIHCLAQNIHHEARGESTRGQKAVASVTMNRVRSKKYPKTVCAVVRQPNQFSWVGRQRPAPISRIDPDIISIARRYVLSYNPAKMDVTNGAISFHSTRVNPRWKLKRVAQIGNHVFYRPIKRTPAK